MKRVCGRLLAAAVLLALVTGCPPASSEPGRSSNPDSVAATPAPKETSMVMEALFDTAVKSSGQAYLDADRKLRDAGPAAVPTLRAHLQDPDPIARLVARTTLDWSEGSAADYQAVLDYLEYLPNRISRTPITRPSPLGIAGYLSLHFGAKAVDLLAARVVKGTDLPHWRVMGMIFYLKEQARPSATEALLRFAAETANDDWRSAAVEAIRAAHDPDLGAKITAERQYQAALGKSLPAALEALAAPHP